MLFYELAQLKLARRILFTAETRMSVSRFNLGCLNLLESTAASAPLAIDLHCALQIRQPHNFGRRKDAKDHCNC